MSLTPKSSWRSFAVMQTKLSRKVSNSLLTTAEKKEVLNEAYREIWFDCNWRERWATDTITLVAGTAEYQLPETCDKIITIKHPQWNIHVEHDRDYLEDREYNVTLASAETTGVPGKARLMGDTIRFSPVPTTEAGDGDELTLEFFADLMKYETDSAVVDKVAGELVEDDDYPALNSALHDLIINKAVLLALEDDREIEKVYLPKLKKYEQAFAKIKAQTLSQGAYPNVLRIRR